MSIVFITEKPSVAREYRKILHVSDSDGGKGYYEGQSSVMNANTIITWAVGHLVSLCTPDKQNPDWAGNWSKSKLPMIPDKYKYAPIEGTADQFHNVKSVYTRSDIDCIYYAGDSGREGIYIQALIRNQIFKSNPKCKEKVVWISSFSEPAILEGIKTAKPYSEYQNMVDSGYARAISDWLIGMNFTQGFTLTSNKLINTGRVITPTLAMIVNRQNEIDNFKKTDFYGVQASNGAAWKVVKGSRFFESDLLYNDNGFIKKSDAEKLVAGCNGDKSLKVDKAEVKEKKEYAPHPFSLLDLQVYCSKFLKMSPDVTLKIAQSLYENKYTTYPRTDTNFLDTKTQADLKNHGYNIPDRYVDDSKVTDHYAIIPDVNGRGLSSDTDLLSGEEKTVYEIIEKRFLDLMKPAFIYDAVSITYKHSCGEFFFIGFKNVKALGWREGQNVDTTQTPVPAEGSIVPVDEFTIRNMETKPPVPFTTDTLLQAMDNAGRFVEDDALKKQLKACKGIGTPATRSEIIKRLADKQFIVIDKKQKVAPTEFGMKVIPIIAKYDETLVSPVKTAEMEMQLERIANGELTIDDYLAEINEYVRSTTKNILANQDTTFASERGGGSGATYKCPKCGGDVVHGKFGWYCKTTPKCGFYPQQKVFGHELTEKAVEALLSGKQTSFTANGKKTIVLPEITEREYNGKTYYNWQTKNG